MSIGIAPSLGQQRSVFGPFIGKYEADQVWPPVQSPVEQGPEKSILISLHRRAAVPEEEPCYFEMRLSCPGCKVVPGLVAVKNIPH